MEEAHKNPEHTFQVEDDSSQENNESLQKGVQKAEAVAMSWNKASLYIAYAGMFLQSFATSFELQITILLAAYATSSFGTHSMLSTVAVITGVLNAVVQPPMAKIADAFGRPEAMTISLLFYIAGYGQMALSKNIGSYASAQIFYALGSTGIRILQQVFIADSSDLLNRALLSSLPDIPYLATVWAGPKMVDAMLRGLNWRVIYAVWTIVTPVCSLPLILSLFLNQRKAKKTGLIEKQPGPRKTVKSVLLNLWYELDAFGTVLLCASFTLMLVPLTIVQSSSQHWRNAGIIVMLIVGVLCFIGLFFWEKSAKLAPRPIISLRLLKNRTTACGISLAFFYFMAFYLSVQPYFYSYLQVVHGQSIVAAGHITQTFSFVATVTSVIVSLAIKYTARYKPFLLFGAFIYSLGIWLMIPFRNKDTSLGLIIFSQVLIGAGGGMTNVPAQLGVQASVETHQDVGAATALFLTLISLGGAFGGAVSGAVWSHHVQVKLAKYLPSESVHAAKDIFGSIVKAMEYPMGSPERTAIIRSYDETMHILLIIAGVVCIPVLILAFLMENLKLDEIDQKVKGTIIGSAKAKSNSETVTSEEFVEES